MNAITNDFSQIQPLTLLTRSNPVGHFVVFEELHLRKLWPIYDCYFAFWKSSEIQNKSQIRKLSWMPNVFLIPPEVEFRRNSFLKSSQLCSRMRPIVCQKRKPSILITCYTEAMFILIPSLFVYIRLTFYSSESRMYVCTTFLDYSRWATYRK